MKKLNRFFSVSLVFVFLITSCTMEKRLYRPGYYVSHKKSNTEHAKQAHNSSEDIAITSKKETDVKRKESLVQQAVSIDPERGPTAEKTILTFSGSDKKVAHHSPLQRETKQTTLSNQKVKYGSSVQQKNHSSSGRDGGGQGIGRGILMILVALLLLGLGAIFAGISGGFGVLIFWFFGLAALILIIFGIVVIIKSI